MRRSRSRSGQAGGDGARTMRDDGGHRPRRRSAPRSRSRDAVRRRADSRSRRVPSRSRSRNRSRGRNRPRRRDASPSRSRSSRSGRSKSPVMHVRKASGGGFDQKTLMPEDFAVQQTLARIAAENPMAVYQAAAGVGPSALGGAPRANPEVEAFLANNTIEPHAASRLRSLPPEQQQMVIQNSLVGVLAQGRGQRGLRVLI